MKITDEQLMAYADGELDADGRATVEAAMASDPELQRRVARQQALRDKLRASFDAVLAEPVPDRLIGAARSAPTAADRDATGNGRVADLAAKRAAKSASAGGRRWVLPQWAAMAASIVLGVFIGWAWLGSGESQASLFAARNGALVADGPLAEALDRQLASAQSAEALVQIGVSFRNQASHYCRTFGVQGGEGLAGMACKAGEDWRVQVLEQGARDAAGGYRMAAGQMPAAVLQAVQAGINGEPLDAQAEDGAQRSGWK